MMTTLLASGTKCSDHSSEQGSAGRMHDAQAASHTTKVAEFLQAAVAFCRKSSLGAQHWSQKVPAKV